MLTVIHFGVFKLQAHLSRSGTTYSHLTSQGLLQHLSPVWLVRVLCVHLSRLCGWEGGRLGRPRTIAKLGGRKRSGQTPQLP